MMLRRPALRIFIFLFAALLVWAAGKGFRTEEQFEAHYRKHGREFGNISKQEYLRLAQELRDAPAGKDILEARRRDGVLTKFDRRKGYFGAYNPDGSIRTFFIPVAGESYFRRQATR